MVAALRAEIAALDDQLNGRPVQPYVPSAPPSSAGGRPVAGRAPSYVAPPSGSSAAAAAAGAGLRTRTEQLADKAYEMVRWTYRQPPHAHWGGTEVYCIL